MNAPTPTPAQACPSCGRERLAGARFCTYCGATFAGSAQSSAGRALTRRVVPRGDRGDLLYVVIAALLAVVISDLPLVNVVIYPFRLFETLVHEWSHAV